MKPVGKTGWKILCVIIVLLAISVVMSIVGRYVPEWIAIILGLGSLWGLLYVAESKK